MTDFKEYILKNNAGKKVDSCHAASIKAAKDHLQYYHENRKGEYTLIDEKSDESIDMTF